MKLERATLSFNLCINEDFEDKMKIALLSQVVKNSCGFCEKIFDITNCEMMKEIREMQSKNDEKFETFVKESLNDPKSQSYVSKILEENQNLQQENAALKVELNECKSLSEKNSLKEIDKPNPNPDEIKNFSVLLEKQANYFQECTTRDSFINLEAKVAEITNKTATIAKLEAELRAAKDQRALTEEFQLKLEAQNMESCNLKIQALLSGVEKIKAQLEFCSTRPLRC